MKGTIKITSFLVGLVVWGCSPVELANRTDESIIRSAFHDFRVVTVVEGLVHPFAMQFLPGGDMLVTERPGRLRIVRDGVLLEKPVDGLPEILALGQGAISMDGREQAGLRDVILHPDFASNRMIYLSFTGPEGVDPLGNLTIVRGRFENDELTEVEKVFTAVAPGNGTDRSSMWGARMVFDKAGYLFMTIGDRQWPSEGDLAIHPAQNLSNHNGTTVRLHDDGRIPEDNPFVGVPEALPEIWTYGHRNAQGIEVHPETGEIWLNEHGPQGGDELNLLRPGLNYGWPVVGYGVNYRTGLRIHDGTHSDDTEQPRHIWVPSIGISGMLVYTGDQFPDWKGDMFVGGLRGERLERITMRDEVIVAEETLIRDMGRIRDVRQGPDGYIYLAVDGDARGFDGDPTNLMRLEPVGYD
tara:strand:- start:18757 stop:19992 length:1236 start_codon:yes stop_codon:yes gene_type:complete